VVGPFLATDVLGLSLVYQTWETSICVSRYVDNYVRLELICAGEILSLSRPICLLLFLLVDADEQLDENPALNLQILLYTDCYIRRVSVLTANFWR
jgi:hypothetical protein